MQKYLLENGEFFFDELNCELVCEEQEIIKIVYELLVVIDRTVQGLDGNFDTYEGCCNLWLKNIINYTKEAFNSVQLGNFVSFAMMQRCIVENYVCACFIKRYKDERLWEKWFVSSMVSTSFMLNKLSKNKYQHLQLNIDEFCNEAGISVDWDVKATYGWTSEIIKKRRPTFFDLCDNINPSYYNDYRFLCDYAHGVNAINKTYRFTFVESYIHLITTFVLYIQRSVEELQDDITDQAYWKKKQMFWDEMKVWRIKVG